MALVAAIVTGVGIYAAARSVSRDRKQKEQADFRAAWWDRAEWGLEKSLSTDERVATFGYEFLERLTEWIAAWAQANGGTKLAEIEARLIVSATEGDLTRAVEQLGVALQEEPPHGQTNTEGDQG